MRGEPGTTYCPVNTRAFQLTRPVRGEPQRLRARQKPIAISTHSPRAGRTESNYIITDDLIHFNSLAPCGANRTSQATISRILRFQLTRPVRGEPTTPPRSGQFYAFQLTRPVRGEPISIVSPLSAMIISTHSPRAGRTFCIPHFLSLSCHFNSLAPCGANPLIFRVVTAVREISTHSPRAGRTWGR